ncbi:prepilin-type N-terminal cleavage/methylation domain-containing protein [Elusimicrobium posterum]|uniref:type IV pilin protein n=1 Tax=Elusimicrobium posterum TaxID=3116653 RepID=UPI003C7208A4
MKLNCLKMPPPLSFSKRLNTSGFTLIELLVVVLIIGILAAIALPQYNKAVERARVTEIIIGMRTIQKAQQEYFLMHSEYATDLTELTLADIPGYTPSKYDSDNDLMVSDKARILFHLGTIVAVPMRSGCQTTSYNQENLSCYTLRLKMDSNEITCTEPQKEPIKLTCKHAGF